MALFSITQVLYEDKIDEVSKVLIGVSALCTLLSACGGGGNAVTLTPTRTIIMVWDGLRPDSVNATDTPN